MNRMNGRRLRLLRRQLHKTQTDMAFILGISLTQWRNYEHGRRQMSALLDRVTFLLDQGIITPENLEPAVQPRPPEWSIRTD